MDDKVMIDYAKYARIFKVMSNPKRLKIIDMLSEGELCACKILEAVSYTHHLKLLYPVNTASTFLLFSLSQFQGHTLPSYHEITLAA